jgi:hypothetical protein
MISLSITVGAVALIVGILAEEWATVIKALRRDRPFGISPLPLSARPANGDRRARVIRVRSQSSPRHAAA